MTDPTTYPGRIPPTSYVMAGGEVHAVDEVGAAANRRFGLRLEQRTAVVAAGSNAAPARLADKCGPDAVVPVIRTHLAGSAIVYSAHVTRYGSIAATRVAHATSVATVHVTLLDAVQLDAIDASEGSYERVAIGAMPNGSTLYSYRSWRGTLRQADQPLRVAEIPAESSLTALSQRQALDLAALRSGAAADGTGLARGVANGEIDPERVNRSLSE